MDSSLKTNVFRKAMLFLAAMIVFISLMFILSGCSKEPESSDQQSSSSSTMEFTEDAVADAEEQKEQHKEPNPIPESEPKNEDTVQAPSDSISGKLLTRHNIFQDFRPSFDHGPKNAEFQKYIVLHDTEGDSDASSVIDWWDSNGNLVASHFVINKDGSIYQAVPMDRIAHHAGYGDTGNNAQYGIIEDGRDDMRGTTPIGNWASDYAMNAWSIGIELVHVGGSDDYPREQLEALDDLIAYIDEYYGFESQIIDHKDWRTGNSDTSPEFAPYLANYKVFRTHDGDSQPSPSNDSGINRKINDLIQQSQESLFESGL